MIGVNGSITLTLVAVVHGKSRNESWSDTSPNSVLASKPARVSIYCSACYESTEHQTLIPGR